VTPAGVRRVRLDVVQVGAGLWGRSWAELVGQASGCRLAALVDARRHGRDWAAATLGVPTFSSLRRALAAVPADAVLLVSPPATHRALAEEALATGCHVVIEKPVALELPEARAIADAAARAGRHAVVAQNYRFRRQSRALGGLVRTRALGQLHGVRISFRRDLRRAWVSPRDWRGRMAHPLVLDMAIHHVDLVRAITGLEVVGVDARGWPAPDGPFRHDPTVSALLELDGGVAVSYDGSWATPWPATSWNGDWELVGGRGRVTWSGGVDDALRGVVRLERRGERPFRVPLPRLPALDRLGVLHELRRAIAAGDDVEVSVRDNLRSLAAVLALARSCEERRPIGVDELLAGS
jgi:predicted dehydrogenase